LKVVLESANTVSNTGVMVIEATDGNTPIAAVPNFPSVAVALIVADPAAFAVTRPAATTATVVSLLVQVREESVGGSPEGPSSVAAKRTVSLAIRVAAFGVRVTMATGTTIVMDAFPGTPSDVAVTVIGPGWNACTNPPGDTEALVPAFVLHVTTRPGSGLPLASFGVAVSCSESNSFSCAAPGDTETLATGVGGLTPASPPQ